MFMAKKVILSESQVSRIITEEFVEKSELEKKIKSELSAAIKRDSEFEKRVKNIAADVVKTLFRTLWQKNNLYDNDLRH